MTIASLVLGGNTGLELFEFKGATKNDYNNDNRYKRSGVNHFAF